MSYDRLYKNGRLYKHESEKDNGEGLQNFWATEQIKDKTVQICVSWISWDDFKGYLVVSKISNLKSFNCLERTLMVIQLFCCKIDFPQLHADLNKQNGKIFSLTVSLGTSGNMKAYTDLKPVLFESS